MGPRPWAENFEIKLGKPLGEPCRVLEVLVPGAVHGQVGPGMSLVTEPFSLSLLATAEALGNCWKDFLKRGQLNDSLGYLEVPREHK